MPKQVYSWGKVRAGDIISFRYKGKKQAAILTTLLVLNPKFPYSKKDGTNALHIIGLKLESMGIRPMIRDKETLLQLLENIGTVNAVDTKNEIYTIDIRNTGHLGTNKEFYNKIKAISDKYKLYRTYDWKEAKKSAVFLEPIKLPKFFKERVKASFSESLVKKVDEAKFEN